MYLLAAALWTQYFTSARNEATEYTDLLVEYSGHTKNDGDGLEAAGGRVTAAGTPNSATFEDDHYESPVSLFV